MFCVCVCDEPSSSSSFSSLPPSIFLQDNYGNLIQSAEECAARMWSIGAGNIAAQINSALLRDDESALNSFAPILRILSKYINSKRLKERITVYRGGSSANVMPSHDIVRQPMFVTATADFQTVLKDLKPGSLALALPPPLSLIFSLSPASLYSFFFIPTHAIETVFDAHLFHFVLCVFRFRHASH